MTIAPPAPAYNFDAAQPAEPARRETKLGERVNGRYKLPDPVTGDVKLWTSASTLAKMLDDTSNLERYAMRQVARGMAERPDLVTLAASVDLSDEDGAKSTLNDVARQAKDAARSRAGSNAGTALHNASQRLDQGESLASIRLPEPYDRDLRAYAELKRVAGIVTGPDYIERVVLAHDLGDGVGAGKYDRAAMVEIDGIPAIVDLKSGKTMDYGQLAMAIQQAIYAHGLRIGQWDKVREMWVPGVPSISLDVAYIVHIPIGTGRAQLYRIDIAAGWQYAQLAVQVREARSVDRSGRLFVAVTSATDKTAGMPPNALAETVGVPVLADTHLAAGTFPAHVLAAGGPDHYAAEMAQALARAIDVADWDVVRDVAHDEDADKSDRAIAREVLDQVGEWQIVGPDAPPAEPDVTKFVRWALARRRMREASDVAVEAVAHPHVRDFCRAVEATSDEEALREVWRVAGEHGLCLAETAAVVSARVEMFRIDAS